MLGVAACSHVPPPNYQAGKIEVYKSARIMRIFDYQGLLLREYPIQLGANPIGHKVQEGDERTPEGLYEIETRNPDSKFHLSLKISYPNEADKKRAKALGVSPGGDIFIHGAPNKSVFPAMYQFKPGWTDGCIGVTNAQMREIYSIVADGTPIEIFP